MKKFAKMSLVAAVAVAGFSTTASAKALEDAIKNVDVSGTMVYRYDDRSNDTQADTNNFTSNSYKIGLNLKSKINDDVTANVRTIVGIGNDAAALRTDNGSAAGKTYGDQEADVSVSQVYFSYTGIANTTVKVGKQGLTTPFTVAIDGMGNEQTGSGILALTNVGPVTLAGGYFNSHNLDDSGDVNVGNGTEDIWTVAAMANVGPVALDAWYLDIAEELDVYTIGAKASFDVDAVKLSMGARHTALDLDNDDTDNSLTKVNLGAKMGIFGASVAYGWTDKEGGIGALDNDAKAAFQGWGLNLNNKADSSLLKTNLNVQVLPSLNVAVNYNVLERDATGDTDAKEYYTQLTYKMSKNFSGYARLGQVDSDAYADKGSRGRLHVTYSF